MGGRPSALATMRNRRTAFQRKRSPSRPLNKCCFALLRFRIWRQPQHQAGIASFHLRVVGRPELGGCRCREAKRTRRCSSQPTSSTKMARPASSISELRCVPPCPEVEASWCRTRRDMTRCPVQAEQDADEWAEAIRTNVKHFMDAQSALPLSTSCCNRLRLRGTRIRCTR